MTLFVFTICLLAERFLGSLDAFRKFGWFTRFQKALLSRLKPNTVWKSRLALLVLLGAPVILVQIAYAWMSAVFALFGFIFACAMVLYCFGPKGFYEETRAFCDALRGRQNDTARWYASTILGQEFKDTPPSEIAPIIGEHLYVIANDRIFAVMFWYAVLGPAGAMLYRLSSLLHARATKVDNPETIGFNRLVIKVHYWIAWGPSRLLVLGYAATGNFVESMSRCSQGAQSCAEHWPNMNERMLVCAGTGQDPADQVDPIANIERGLALLRRTTVLWVGLTALITLTRWAS